MGVKGVLEGGSSMQQLENARTPAHAHARRDCCCCAQSRPALLHTYMHTYVHASQSSVRMSVPRVTSSYSALTRLRCSLFSPSAPLELLRCDPAANSRHGPTRRSMSAASCVLAAVPSSST